MKLDRKHSGRKNPRPGKEATLVVIKKKCPRCKHSKMWFYPSVDALYRYKCTKCKFIIRKQ